MSSISVYFNRVQIAFVKALQKVRVLIAGRGFGKSTLLAWIIYEMVRAMPRAKVFFASTTVEQIRNSTLPPIIQKWAEFRLKEDVHYVIGKKPPDWFKRPISPPKEFGNIITFFNGFTIALLSTAKPPGKRGGSYDAGLIDEAAFVKGSVFKSVFMPMIRGNIYRFESHWHHSLIVISSRPRKSDGYWLYEFKKTAKENPNDVLYVESSAYANKDVLGEAWFIEQRRTLGHDEYAIEIDNKEMRQTPTGFYHTFNRDTICYQLRTGESDINRDELLEVTWDFGGKFTCMTVWQESNFVERCVDQFYSKQGDEKVSSIVDQFCRRYVAHGMKYVRIWGEPRGKDHDTERPDLFSIIEQRFNQRGWQCELKVQPGKRTPLHRERYNFFETLFASTDRRLPQIGINIVQASDLVISIEITDCDDEFRKIKTAEKDPSFPQEHAPHLSDGMDYYLYEKHGWRLLDDGNSRPGQAW